MLFATVFSSFLVLTYAPVVEKQGWVKAIDLVALGVKQNTKNKTPKTKHQKPVLENVLDEVVKIVNFLIS